MHAGQRPDHMPAAVYDRLLKKGRLSYTPNIYGDDVRNEDDDAYDNSAVVIKGVDPHQDVTGAQQHDRKIEKRALYDLGTESTDDMNDDETPTTSQYDLGDSVENDPFTSNKEDDIQETVEGSTLYDLGNEENSSSASPNDESNVVE